MRRSIIIMNLILIAADPVCGGDLDSHLDDAVLQGAGVLSFYCALITYHNAIRLREDHPSKIGGVAGVLFGAPTALGGIAILADDEFDGRGWGLPVAAVGVMTAYYGIKNIIAVRRKYFEEKERKLEVRPSVRRDPSGGTSYGMMLVISY